LHNLSGKPQTIELPANRFRMLIKHSRADTTIASDHLHLPPYGSAILQ
jgi:hypothetical protein